MNTRIKLLIGFVCFCIVPVTAAALVMFNRVEGAYFDKLKSEQRLALELVAGIIDEYDLTNTGNNEAINLKPFTQHPLPSGSHFYLTDTNGHPVFGFDPDADILALFNGMAAGGQQSVQDQIGLVTSSDVTENGIRIFNHVPAAVIQQELKRIRWQAVLLLTIAVIGMCGGASMVYGYFIIQAAKIRNYIGRLAHPNLPLPAAVPDGEFEDIGKALMLQAEALQQCESQLNDVNITDPLTGVYNRQVILSKLEEEIAKTKRYTTPLTAIAITIDRFSLITERFGYELADEVVCRLTALLQASLRSHDLVGRLEANSFLVILPLTQVENGKVICDRIRGAAEVSYWGNPDLQLTISGAAVSPDNVDVSLRNLEELVQLARGQGGNRILMA